jgi:serine/threonine-protein kinase RsbW
VTTNQQSQAAIALADTIRLELPATYKYLNILGNCLSSMVESVDGLGEPKITSYNVQLAVHEVCTNIIQHAYTHNPENERISISLTLYQNPRRLQIDLLDSGRPFDITSVKEPDLLAGQIHGYGLFLIKNLMDEVDYTRMPEGNHWRLVKNL